MYWKSILAAVALAAVAMPTASVANSIGSVEGARAKERQGRWLDRQERESLRRWGGNDDYRYYRARPYDDGYYGDYYDRGPGVRLYIGPR